MNHLYALLSFILLYPTYSHHWQYCLDLFITKPSFNSLHHHNILMNCLFVSLLLLFLQVFQYTQFANFPACVHVSLHYPVLSITLQLSEQVRGLIGVTPEQTAETGVRLLITTVHCGNSTGHWRLEADICSCLVTLWSFSLSSLFTFLTEHGHSLLFTINIVKYCP